MPTADDHTAVTSPPAPWDEEAGQEASDVAEAPRQTAPTSVIQPSDYEVAAGTKLGEYQIESKLGEGGMGDVFTAVHPLIGKRAAIKILKKELCVDPQSVERFIDEARVVNQIGHPNIVDIFAFGEMPDGRRYFVMEWLKGETLRARIAAGRPELTETCRIVRQLARALQAAHDKGVIHRDLKPDNVFLVEMRDEPSQVKLLDFGIAKLARNDRRVEKTATGAIVGTPQYIAPEQAKGYAIDHRVDIYALGGILFELISGRPPFIADNAMEIVAKHLMETPVRVSTLAPDVPPQLDELIDQMLAKAPDKRPSLVKIVEVMDVIRGRASTQAARTDASQPFARPFPDSAPIAAVSASAPAAVALSRPAFDAAAEPDSLAPRKKVPWIAIAGVPVAGLIAFLVVRSLGGSSTDDPPKKPPVAESKHADNPPPKKVDAPPKKVEAPPKQAETPTKEPDPPQKAPVQVAVAEPVKQPPSPPPPPAKGRLKLTIVNATPATIVLIDGQPADANALLPLGTHSVEVRSKGRVPQKLTVELGRAGVAKRIVLEPKERKQQPQQPKSPLSVPEMDDDKDLIKPGTLKPRR